MQPPSSRAAAADRGGQRRGRAACFRLLLAMAACLLCLASAEDVRSLGMGGVLVPGPGAAARNPAYAAVPGSGGTSLSLPLGALSTGLSTDWDPNSDDFDAIALIDRLAHLDRFVLNPAQAPDAVDFRVDANGIRIDVTGGSPLRLGQASRFGSSFDLPVGGSIGPVHLAVRPYATAYGTFQPGPGLAAALAGGSDAVSGSVTADAEAGVALDLRASLPLPFPPEVMGGGAAYAGGRLSAKLGLARAALDGEAVVTASKDPGGAYTGNTTETYDATLALGGLAGGGLGFGVEADLGFAVVTPSETGTLTLGFAVENLGVMFWSVERTRYQGVDATHSRTDLGSRSLVDVAPRWGLGGNVALQLDPEQLGTDLFGLLLAADAGYAADAGLTAHVGAEATFGGVAARVGLGYQDGLQFGVGAGLQAAGVGFDVALASHRSPFTTHRAYGLAAGVRLPF